jgi:hypothetical protein
MASKPQETRRLKDVLRDADSVCRESARIRSYAEDVMRHRPFWPDQRHDSRPEGHGDTGDSSAHS